MIKSKSHFTFRRANINRESVKTILNNEQWPSTSWSKTNESTFWKRYTIRATVKLQQDANEIFKKNINWSLKQIQIKDTFSESFKKYIPCLDLKRKSDITQFYKIINSLLKYKSRGKIIKGIKCNEEIIIENKKNYLKISLNDSIVAMKPDTKYPTIQYLTSDSTYGEELNTDLQTKQLDWIIYMQNSIKIMIKA